MPVICTLNANVVMMPSTAGDTFSVRVACTTAFATIAAPCRFHVRVTPWLAFEGFQLLVVIESVALAVPAFLIQTVLVAFPPADRVPQFSEV